MYAISRSAPRLARTSSRISKRSSRSCLSGRAVRRSEEHTSELQSLMRISYAVFCLKKKKQKRTVQVPKHNYNRAQEKRQKPVTNNKQEYKRRISNTCTTS